MSSSSSLSSLSSSSCGPLFPSCSFFNNFKTNKQNLKHFKFSSNWYLCIFFFKPQPCIYTAIKGYVPAVSLACIKNFVFFNVWNRFLCLLSLADFVTMSNKETIFFFLFKLDTSKADEYQHILGNLNHIMNILSQQQSTSFRQSVRYQRPETPKKKKPRNKVSSLAIILGRDKKSLRNKQRLSSNKMASAARKAEGKAKDKATTSGHDKKNVPKLKVNDRPV